MTIKYRLFVKIEHLANRLFDKAEAFRMAKTDKRILKTKEALLAALSGLLKEKSLSSITVSELCKSACINRNTFYAHYRSPEEIFQEICKKVLHSIFLLLKKQSDSRIALNKICKYIKRHQDICSVLLSDHCENKFTDLLIRYAFHSGWNKIYNEKSKFERRFFKMAILFGINGSISVMRYWIAHEMKESPEEIAELIYELCLYGTRGENQSTETVED